jgi:hypothetical protein
MATRNNSGRIEIVGTKVRRPILASREPFLRAVQKVLNDLDAFRPLSLRQIHYNLLNDPPLINAKSGKRYTNNADSYNQLSILKNDAIAAGLLPEDVTEDATRPVIEWAAYFSVDQFIDQQAEDFLTGYQRDLQQSQPDYVELWVEKNTVLPIIRPIAGEFRITITSGRGYGSWPPIRDLKDRLVASGKARLVLLVVSDFDPEGDDLAHALPRVLRDQFGVDNIEPFKIGLRQEQTDNLPESFNPPKRTSPRYKKFVAQYGKGQKVYELEAVPPAQLQRIVRDAIRRSLNMAAFERERRQEKVDLDAISNRRATVLAALRG